ncbi:MAG TPA: hypothetical protein VJP86_14220, partial [Vicinamibacterales bacterium]|nr:hypothetical protein [Vicinamibacterales bacterium]
RGAAPAAGGRGAAPAAGGRGAAPAAAARGGAAAGRGNGLQPLAFATLAEYSQTTRQDQHSVLVDYDVFVNVPKLDAQDRTKVQQVYKAESFDFRLKPGAAAIDRGTPLAGVTDGFAGSAPDLGAIELGEAPIHYGPR